MLLVDIQLGIIPATAVRAVDDLAASVVLLGVGILFVVAKMLGG